MRIPESPISQSSNSLSTDHKMIIVGGGATSRKRPRADDSSITSSSSPCAAIIVDSSSPSLYDHLTSPIRNPNPNPIHKSTDLSIPSFNHVASADVILFLSVNATLSDPASSDDSLSTNPDDDAVLYLHASRLRRCNYFAAVLSERWKQPQSKILLDSDEDDDSKPYRILLSVPPTPGAVQARISILRLLYNDDLASAITTAADAISLLPVALELLFEDCVRRCVRFLEAVPWTEEEESRVLALLPLLSDEESKDLRARVSAAEDAGEEMLYGLITSVNIHNPKRMPYGKAFVAKLLREFSSIESAARVLEKAFLATFKVVKESMEDYNRPRVRGDHNETEAIQKMNLHTASKNGRHLGWLVERMIELKVADATIKEWTEQPSFTADLQRAFHDDAWKNITPGLPGVLLGCTAMISSAIVSGNILVAVQVRKKLVSEWLPVMIVLKDHTSPPTQNNKLLYVDNLERLEETFPKIISTLPMLDAQKLLQQCLVFLTRNFDDCPHLVMAFNSWFRRAARPPQALNPC